MKKTDPHEKTYQSPTESLSQECATELSLKQKSRLILHLFAPPLAALEICVIFIVSLLIIPTIGQMLMIVATAGICFLIFNTYGPHVFHAYKHDRLNAAQEIPDDYADKTFLTPVRKRLLGYYSLFLLAITLTIAVGAYLNATIPTPEEREQGLRRIEKILRINLTDKSSQNINQKLS